MNKFNQYDIEDTYKYFVNDLQNAPYMINLLQPGVTFLYPVKTSENCLKMLAKQNIHFSTSKNDNDNIPFCLPN